MVQHSNAYAVHIRRCPLHCASQCYRRCTNSHGHISGSRQAAGVIHSDFEKGFIRAQVIGYDDLVHKADGSEKLAQEKGLIRSEGRDYVMQEGDIAVFRFN